MSADELPAVILNDPNDLKDFKDFIFHDSSFEKLDRRNRRRATFENKHIIALQPLS